MPFKAIVKNARIIESCLKSLKLPIKALNYYCPQTKFKKVMFYRCLSVHRGAWCTPPRTRSRHPPGPKADTLLDRRPFPPGLRQTPPGQTPPSWILWDTVNKGRYASYWNAFLLEIFVRLFDLSVFRISRPFSFSGSTTRCTDWLTWRGGLCDETDTDRMMLRHRNNHTTDGGLDVLSNVPKVHLQNNSTFYRETQCVHRLTCEN